MQAYFLSDIHLKSVNERSGQILIRFLNSLIEKKESDLHLFFLGDIFEFWLSGHDVFIRKYNDILELIRKLKDQGAYLYFFEGNHDLHIHPYWRDELGFKVYTSAEHFFLDGLVLRCEHGDEINQDDKAYLLLRKFVRNPIIETLGHQIPGKAWDFIGNTLSEKSRARSSVFRKEKEAELIAMIREHAEKTYEQKSFDAIISGHMHVRDEYMFLKNNKKVFSFNLGSWFEQACVLHLQDGQFNWENLS